MAFPNQIDRIILNMEQAEVLTSFIRSEVFWAFSMTTPFSVAEVAKGLGKSAQTVHYHVKELIRVGLLIPAGTRQHRSRTETLYIHAAYLTIDAGKKGTPEYNALRAKSFKFTAKRLVQETEALYAAMALDPSYNDLSLFKRLNVSMSPERFLELRAQLAALIRELLKEEPEEGGVRIHVMFYMRPTLAQSRSWIEERGGSLDIRDEAEEEEE